MGEEDNGKSVSKLIQEVSLRPVLYDPQHLMYKDNIARMKAWQSIAEKMNMQVTNCQIKWGTLRRCLANARKRQKRRQTMGSKYIKKWRYQDEMSFLLPFIDNKESEYTFIEHSKKKTIHPDDHGDSSNRSQDLYISEEYDHAELEDTEVKPTSENLQQYLIESAAEHAEYRRAERSKSLTSYGKTPEELYEEEEMILEPSDSDKDWDPLQKRPDEYKSSNLFYQSLDEMDTFFLSMSKTLKKLPKLEQIKVRSKIYELITQAEVNWLKTSSSSE